MIEQLSEKGLVTYYTRVSDIRYLYSEGDNDPEIMAKLDAPNLAVDKYYNPLPYVIICKPIPINKVETQILIFADEECKQLYEDSLR